MATKAKAGDWREATLERIRALINEADPDMIEELEQSLTARGFRKHTRLHPGTLHLEKYWTD